MSRIYHKVEIKQSKRQTETIVKNKPRVYWYPTDVFTAQEAVADAVDNESLPGDTVTHKGFEYA